jgi:hypothetical protein
LNELKSKANEYGKEITWPKTGEKYLALAEKILKEEHQVITDPNRISICLFFRHFRLLTSTG